MIRNVLKKRLHILTLIILTVFLPEITNGQESTRELYFYGDSIKLNFDKCATVDYTDTLSVKSITQFYDNVVAANYDSLINDMRAYKLRHNPDDWVYYQLIRKVAQYISPKEDNYYRYTLYKWYLLKQCDYNTTLNIAGDKLLLYVQSDENIYDIPYYLRYGKQYVCLNYHDYGKVDLKKTQFIEVTGDTTIAKTAFSYRLTQLPEFKDEDYKEKDLEFNYNDYNYTFKIKVNPEVKNIFKNYPVADYELYFNAPLSKETYNSLIPELKKNIKGMSVKNGVDYLMHFTRYAFLYETDVDNFGKEKRLSPEQTLLYDHSDCEDRAALFYCLVKEIYNLPMIVLEFPKHVTIAVKFNKPIGKPIMYNGNAYSVCEPTPQEQDLQLGYISPELSSVRYQVAYAYNPNSKK